LADRVDRTNCWEKCIQNFSQKSKGERPFRKPRYRWEGNIKHNIEID